ncbi:uncharacterized [Tachysurus ichikawai]
MVSPMALTSRLQPQNEYNTSPDHKSDISLKMCVRCAAASSRRSCNAAVRLTESSPVPRVPSLLPSHPEPFRRPGTRSLRSL